MREHKDACRKGMKKRSAVVEHAWDQQHQIEWEEASVMDQVRGSKVLGKELFVKEALHIQIAPTEECINYDGGIETPGC